MNIISSLFITLFAPLLVSAQTPLDNSTQLHSTMLNQQGQLVSVRLVLGEPIRIFVVGKEEAKLDLSKLKLTVRRLKPYPGKVLSLDQNVGGYFTISEPVNLKEPTDLDVTTKIKDQTETLHFKLENNKH